MTRLRPDGSGVSPTSKPGSRSTDRTSTRHAYVVFDHAYHDRRDAALGWMQAQGLIPLGRFGRFEYDNSDQCVIKARALAAELLERAALGS